MMEGLLEPGSHDWGCRGHQEAEMTRRQQTGGGGKRGIQVSLTARSCFMVIKGAVHYAYKESQSEVPGQVTSRMKFHVKIIIIPKGKWIKSFSVQWCREENPI